MNGISSFNKVGKKEAVLSQHLLNACANENKKNLQELSFEENIKEIRNGNLEKWENLTDYMLNVAKELGQRQSFYVLDLADVLRKIQNWRKKLPSVEIFYAVKANSDPVLLRLLVLLGLSFDCATEGEIKMMLEIGASPRNILWAHTVKTEEGLRYAQEVGVDFMTFDSRDELEKIKIVFPNARLLLRVCPSKVDCKFDLSEKFGCSADEAMDVLTRAKSLEMSVEGISFHVGALCAKPEAFTQTIRDCADLFRTAQQIGFHFSVLNLGGGFLGASGTEDIFDKVTEKIRSSLRESFPDPAQIRLMAEPGCYVVGSAMQLITTVIGKRTVKEAGKSCKHYFLNNGIYGSFFRDVEYYGMELVPLLDGKELASRPKSESILFGQTCCSEDVIQKNRCLLPELHLGECVSWTNMGAYSNVLCSTFCGVPIPKTVHVFLESSGIDLEEIMSVKDFLEKNVNFIQSVKAAS